MLRLPVRLLPILVCSLTLGCSTGPSLPDDAMLMYSAAGQRWHDFKFALPEEAGNFYVVDGRNHVLTAFYWTPGTAVEFNTKTSGGGSFSIYFVPTEPTDSQ